MTNIIALIIAIAILYFLPGVKFMRDLGVNETAPLMAVFFGVSYFFISQFLVKPYKANLSYRKKNTGGSLTEANDLNTESEKLTVEYQGKLKSQNEAAANLYEKYKAEGLVEEEKLVSAAKKNGATLLDQTKKKIETEIVSAKDKLKTQIPEISELIASRVLGRDL